MSTLMDFEKENQNLVNEKYIELLKAEILMLQKNEEILKADLYQQKFNNAHNLSIDQQVADKIKDLEYQFNNSKMFHCPHFLTNGGGGISCQSPDLQELAVLRETVHAQNKVIQKIILILQGHNVTIEVLE